MTAHGHILIAIGLLALLLIWWNLYVSVLIVKYLKDRGIDARIAHRRGSIFKYLNTYRKLSIKETGKEGNLYQLFYLSFYLMLSTVLIGAVLSCYW